MSLPFIAITLVSLTIPATTEVRPWERQSLEKIEAFAQHELASRGSLPSGQEVAEWMRQMDKLGSNFDGSGYTYSIDKFPAKVRSEFGEPPKNSFVIGWWNGDSDVVFASWQKDRSVAAIGSSSYVLGSRLGDLLLWSSFSLAFFGNALIVLRRAMTSVETTNPSVKGAACAKAQAAPYVER
ncbi:MAG: hypothetical protein KGL73_02705 [Burkholderiales bacterium]|nr:hypothetical protein [Burkholderiales bacterium]